MSIFSHPAFALVLLALLACPSHAGAKSNAYAVVALKSEKTFKLDTAGQTMALCVALESLANRRMTGMADISKSTMAACHKCQTECRSFSVTHDLTDLCQC